jgi:L-histidine N-alpha-methyltransferase
MTSGRVWIEVHGEVAESRDVEARAVWDGLMQPLPAINPKYFYDDRGSELFERITQLPEYYQTRTELAMLERLANEIAGRARPHELVELGSGAGRKVHLLLNAIRDHGLLTTCVLLDVNTLFLRESAQRLAADYPEMLVRGVQGDFTRDLGAIGPGAPRLFILLAGTIGNLSPSELGPFLATVRSAMVADDRFLVGLDLVKDPARLEAAYNDAAGVTAEFNRNILSVLNSRFATDFDPSAFEHRAFWDPEHRWIEMRLRAIRPVTVTMKGEDRVLRLEAGSEIRTELSCKFSRESLGRTLDAGGFRLDGWWTDPAQDFALALLRPEVDR